MLEIPPWKAEFLERKKAAKIKAEQVPEWKRELLKRLQTKAEAAKHRMDTGGKENGQAVLNEHIMKVSDNIFVKQERHRKMSASDHKSPTPTSPTKEFPPGGFHVIKTESIVIIEKDAATDNEGAEHGTKESDKEMPESGIVNRLKDRFADGKQGPIERRRAQSSENVLNAVNPEAASEKPEEREDPVYHRTFSAPAKPTTTTSHTPKLANTSKASSLDFYTPRSFSQSHGVRKVTSPTRKFSTPVLQVKNDSPKKAEPKNVDIANLHSSGSPKHSSPPIAATKSNKNQQQAPNLEYSVDLHSGGHDSVPLPASDVDKVETSKTQHKTPAETTQKVTVLPSVESFVIDTSKFQETTKPVKKLPALDKENIPQTDVPPVAPPRAKTANRIAGNQHQKQTKPKDVAAIKPVAQKTDVKKNNFAKTEAKKNNFEIIDLGKTSMDPSLLKTPGAIYANEIMKESKTLRIIPKAKTQNSTVAAKPVKQPSPTISPPVLKTERPKSPVVVEIHKVQSKPESTKDVKADIAKGKIVNKQITQTPVKEVNHSLPKVTKPLPASSVDDVIIKVAAPAPKNNVVRSNFNHVQEVQTVTNRKTETKPKPVETTVASSTNSTNTSAPSVKDMFGPRKGGMQPSKGGAFGGKSFVFDPKKFKKSAAPPITTKTTTTFDPAGLPRTMVIKPSQNSAAKANDTTEDGKVQGKGKRKPTVDQIQVIGGYVKLEHCTLSKKTRKTVTYNVCFKQERLETVYQYPSERSLLQEDHEISMEQKSKLNKLPGSGKDSQLGKYTPKYLLSMKDKLTAEDDDDVTTKQTDVTMTSTDAIPVDDVSAFSSIDSSTDILF